MLSTQHLQKNAWWRNVARKSIKDVVGGVRMAGSLAEEKRKESWKIKQLMKTKRRLESKNKSSFESSKHLVVDHNVNKMYTKYVENLVLATIEEKKVVEKRERELFNSKKISSEYLELRGLAVTDLKLDTKYHIDRGDKELSVRLVRIDGGQLPGNGLRRGQLVSLELIDSGGQEGDSWSKRDGIVNDVGVDWILVSISGSLEGWILDGLVGRLRHSLRLVKRAEVEIFHRNVDQLKMLLKGKPNIDMNSSLGFIMKSLKTDMGAQVCQEEESQGDPVVYNKKLLSDLSKVSALRRCSASPKVHVIHGPPGTGKTTTMAAAVLDALCKGDRVLVTAASHAACDAAVLSLVNQWPTGGPTQGQLVRVGNKLRITDKKVEMFLPGVISDEIQRVKTKLSRIRSELLEGGKGGRGVLMEEEKQVLADYRNLIWEAKNKVVEEARIIVCTLMTTNTNHTLQRQVAQDIDLVCVDEAGFCLDSALIPLLSRMGGRVILAGDHLQLPPVVMSTEAQSRGLCVSLLERLASLNPSCVSLLDTQYRSNGVISDWSSGYFYCNQLRPGDDNKNQVVSDIVGNKGPLSNSPLVWVDTAGSNWEEEREEEEGVSNPFEALIVTDLVTMFLQMGLDCNKLGVISPYWAQVTLLRSLFDEGVEVHTVDGYQGREKEVIIVSLVRSNPKGTVGFLSESRRLNVAVTRARRCCVLVGDSDTLRSDPALASLIKHVARSGREMPYTDTLDILNNTHLQY